MRKIIVFTNLTLDGVMQAPARPDEDLREGFKFGGWAAPYSAMNFDSGGETMSNVGPLLFGRRTYEDFYSVWPNRTDNPYTEVLNKAQKYVASSTLKEPLPWMNSILLNGDVLAALAELKNQPGKDFLVFGSGVLVQSLMQHNLIDRYVLLIHPLILGAGRHLFPDGAPYTSLKLIDHKPTPTGVVIATFQPSQEGSS
jgi:dihydrofolate reductase